jgi:hypothetical protein
MGDVPQESATPAALSRSNWLRTFWGRHGNFTLVTVGLLIVLLLATFRWPGGLRLSGRLVAGTVTVILDEGLQFESDLALDPRNARLSGLQSVVPPPEVAAAAIEARTAIISARHLTLSGVRLGEGVQLTLDSTSNLWFTAAGAGGSLDFEAEGPLSVDLGDRQIGTVASDPLPISARWERTGAVPFVLEAAPLDKLILKNFPLVPAISLLRFGRRQQAADTGATFVSTIVSGTLKLVDLTQEEQLEAGSTLQMDGFNGHLIQLEQTDTGYLVAFAGWADRVRLGPPGFAEDLTPSCLTYLYHQEWIKLTWAAALAGFAALAKVRSWLAGKLD